MNILQWITSTHLNVFLESKNLSGKHHENIVFNNTNFHLTVRLMDNFIYVRLITKNDNEKLSPLKTKWIC